MNSQPQEQKEQTFLIIQVPNEACVIDEGLIPDQTKILVMSKIGADTAESPDPIFLLGSLPKNLEYLYTSAITPESVFPSGLNIFVEKLLNPLELPKDCNIFVPPACHANMPIDRPHHLYITDGESDTLSSLKENGNLRFTLGPETRISIFNCLMTVIKCEPIEPIEPKVNLIENNETIAHKPNVCDYTSLTSAEASAAFVRCCEMLDDKSIELCLEQNASKINPSYRNNLPLLALFRRFDKTKDNRHVVAKFFQLITVSRKKLTNVFWTLCSEANAAAAEAVMDWTGDAIGASVVGNHISEIVVNLGRIASTGSTPFTMRLLDIVMEKAGDTCSVIAHALLGAMSGSHRVLVDSLLDSYVEESIKNQATALAQKNRQYACSLIYYAAKFNDPKQFQTVLTKLVPISYEFRCKSDHERSYAISLENYHSSTYGKTDLLEKTLTKCMRQGQEMTDLFVSHACKIETVFGTLKETLVGKLGSACTSSKVDCIEKTLAMIAHVTLADFDTKIYLDALMQCTTTEATKLLVDTGYIIPYVYQPGALSGASSVARRYIADVLIAMANELVA